MESALFKDGRCAWSLFRFPEFKEESGTLCVIEDRYLLHEVKRVFYVHDVPAGVSRSGHCHVELKQTLLCVSGCVEIDLNWGVGKQTVRLEAGVPVGLFLEGRTWRRLSSFSEGAVLVVACDRAYKDDVVIRSYQKFLESVND